MDEEEAPKEAEGGVISTVQKNLISIVFLVLAAIIGLVLLFSGNGVGGYDAQGIMIWVFLILIAISIILMMRERIYMMLLLYGALAVTYWLEGMATHGLGLGSNFSWGALTFSMISVFVYWAGLQKHFTPKHIYVFLFFILVAYLVNAGGWMEKGNTMTSDMMTKLAGGVHGVIITAWIGGMTYVSGRQ